MPHEPGDRPQAGVAGGHLCRRAVRLPWMPTAKTRWTMADYAAFAAARGGELLTSGDPHEVPRVHGRLAFRCANGHEWTPQAGAIKNQGYWCFRCARAGGRVWKIADFRAYAIERGGKLLDNRPDSAPPLVTDRLTFRCAAGHQWETVAYSVKRDRPWCKVCGRTADPWDAARYRAYAAEHRGRLLSRHPRGVIEHATPVRFRCAAGHEWETTAGQIKSYSTWCLRCSHDEMRKPLDDLHALAAERGGKLVAEGRNRGQPFLWKCSRGHAFKARPSEVRRGYWCSRCSASRAERLVRAHFEQLFGKPFPKVRPAWLVNTTGHRLELDGYCAELSLAFEHQGGQHYREVAHFSRQSLQDIQSRDERKRQLCRERGVTLIEIAELMAETPVAELHRVILRACRAAGVKVPRGAASRTINVAPVYASNRDEELLTELHRIAADHGGQCHAAEYLGASSPLPFECKHGHRWNARPNYISGGSWCRRCALEYTASRKRLTIEMMREIARGHGGECLSDVYVNAATPLRWRCGQCGNEWNATPGSIRTGSWCKPCSARRQWERWRAARKSPPRPKRPTTRK